MNPDQTFDGLALNDWKAMYRPGMPEFPATMCTFAREGKHFVRIAFGLTGPAVDSNGNREKQYTHAVTLPPDLAVELAHLLLKFYGQPDDGSVSTSGGL